MGWAIRATLLPGLGEIRQPVGHLIAPRRPPIPRVMRVTRCYTMA